MNLVKHQRAVQISALAHLFGFMKIVAWDQQKDWVPFKKENKKSVTRAQMEKGASLLARAELGVGIRPVLVEQAIRAIKNWKIYFVLNMKTKINLQEQEACQQRIMLAIASGKKMRCNHDHVLGQSGASLLADSLFRMYYDQEVRAFSEPDPSRYFTREPGPVEFGESMQDEKFLPRQFAEQPTGEFYLAAEDEHAASWKMMEEFPGDDEVVEDENGLTQVIDWGSRNEIYFDLRQDILHRKFVGSKIINKAHAFARQGMISWWQFKKLREFAGAVANYKGSYDI